MKKTIGKLVMALLLSSPLTLSAANYWTINGDGNWDASTLWSPDAANSSQTAAATTVTDDVYFSATNIIAGVVTVSGTQVANNLYLNQAFRFVSGTIDLSTSANGIAYVTASGTFDSALRTKNLTFNAASQTVTVNNGGYFVNIAANSAANAKVSQVSLSGGSFSSGGNSSVNIGDTGAIGGDVSAVSGGLVISSGGTFASSLFFVGSNNHNTGVVRVNGGLWTSGNGLAIGKGSTGRVVVESGTMTNTANDTWAGANPGIVVGLGGNGELDVTGGLVGTRHLHVGVTNNAAQTGLVIISGGTVNVSSTLNFGTGYYGSIASAGSGSLALRGGVLNVGIGGIVRAPEAAAAYTTSIILSGGTLGTTGTAGWKSALDMTLSDANGGVTINADKDIELGGALSGNGGLTKAGGGTLLLTGANTYSGQTIVNTGTFKLAAAGSLTLDLAALGNKSAFVINGGSLALDGTLYLNNAGLMLTDGDSWQLFSGNPGSVSIADIDGFTLSGGVWSDASGDWKLDMSSGLLIYGIPEPSALALMLTGGALLLFLRRKR